MKKINLLNIKKSLETNRPKISLEKNIRDKGKSILKSSLENDKMIKSLQNLEIALKRFIFNP